MVICAGGQADIEFQDSRARQLKIHLAVDSKTSKIQLSGVSRSVTGLLHRKVACGKVSRLQKFIAGFSIANAITSRAIDS